MPLGWTETAHACSVTGVVRALIPISTSVCVALLSACGSGSDDRRICSDCGPTNNNNSSNNNSSNNNNSNNNNSNNNNVQGDVGRYQVYELTIAHDSGGYTNPWEDVDVQATFTAPSGAAIVVDGFFYEAGAWKVRFAPAEVGIYTYQYALLDASGPRTTEDGSFEVGESNERGFVRVHPTNPHRFVFEKDGGLFIAQGLSTCVRDPVATSFPTAEDNKGWCIDKYASTDDACQKTVDEFFDVYVGETEISLFRWTVNNCSFPLWQQLVTDASGEQNVYDAEKGKWGDALLQNLRGRGVRIVMDPIGFGWRQAQPGRISCGANRDQDCGSNVCGPNGNLACTDHNAGLINPSDLASTQRYYRYIVARYGAYVDMWELINEFPLPDTTIAQHTRFIRDVDPYDHVVSTNWARPDHPEIDLSTPHLYQRSRLTDIDVQVVDALVHGRGHDWPSRVAHDKPIIVGEMGEPFQDRTGDPNYELETRHGIRIKYWATFFNEIGSVFWESSLSAAEWLGGVVFFSPEVRTHTRAHMRFVADVPADATQAGAESMSHNGAAVRRYALRGSTSYYLYLVHAVNDVNNPGTVSGLQVQVDLPIAATVQWYDTMTGQGLATESLTAGMHTLTAPDFSFDLALRTQP